MIMRKALHQSDDKDYMSRKERRGIATIEDCVKYKDSRTILKRAKKD